MSDIEEAAPTNLPVEQTGFAIHPAQREFIDGVEVGLPVETYEPEQVIADNSVTIGGEAFSLEDLELLDGEVIEYEEPTHAEVEEVADEDEEPASQVGQVLQVEGHQFTDETQLLAAEIKQEVLDLGFDEPSIDAVMQAYAKRAAQVGAIDNAHADQGVQALREVWGDDFADRLGRIKALLQDTDRISEYLADGLATARLPDGRRLANVPEFFGMLLLYDGATRNENLVDHEELARLDAAMKANPEAFQREEWRAGMTGSEWAYRIRKAQTDRTSRGPNTSMSAEEMELDQLMRNDIGEYMNGRWRGSKQTPSERALELARARSR
jgi:hypothetical protein